MPYIQPEELKTAIYEYQLNEITENDISIVIEAIEAAEQEIYSYLNNLYDTDAIFTAQGKDRNQLLVEYTKNIAVWHIIRLSNVDIIYDTVRERYDRAIKWLEKVASGKLSPQLPQKDNENGGAATRFRFGSTSQKFNHYIE